jgi:hypothetical protein
MRKFYSLVIAMVTVLFVNAQTIIDISAISSTYTKTVDNELVIDVATTCSKIASPKLSLTNPLKGQTFTEAEISFDVYNYYADSLHVLGALFTLYDSSLGRMYFTNGSYLGYNATGGWFDANLINYGIGTSFLSANAWKNVKLQFTSSGYAVYVDNVLAYNQSSTSVTISGSITDYSNVISFFENAAIFVIGTGSWWSDNQRTDGSYYDLQYSYLKNIKFIPNFSTRKSEKQMAEPNGEVVKEEYFNINGVKTSADFSTLGRGVYIKKLTYSNGAVQSSKMVKVQ